MLTENPYESVYVEDVRSWWSGFPAWIKRLAKVCRAIAFVLILVDVPVMCIYFRSNQSVPDINGIQSQIKELFVIED